MKKILIVLFLILLAVAVLLVLRHPKSASKLTILPQVLTTNFVAVPTASNTPPLTQNTNVFIRPSSIDEETWNKILQNRQIILSQNQPIEFYVRIVDQDQQPVEGAKLTISLERLDETMFSLTNYLHWDPAAAYQKKFLDLYSDANGWIQLAGVTGEALRVETLMKEGYSWAMPQTDSFTYEPEGQHRVGYAGMEDAFNPDKGYVFHLTKN
jgi:hypothetical protein